MIDQWLSSMTLERFRRDHLGRRPLAIPASASAARTFDWAAFGRVLAAAPDALVVSGGKLLARPVPRTLGKLVECFRVGIGLALRHTETLDPGLAEIHAAFERELGPAMVQLFATAGGTHGFGWHYDDEDVFIAQTTGIKDYYFRANTVTTRQAHPTEFQRFGDETSELCTATLVPGDFLYLPARWWHMAKCREHALSISVGVYPRASSAASC